MAVQIGNNVLIEVKNALGTAETVTAVTKANPGVATATGHSLTNGDVGFFTITDGMQELHTQVCRVTGAVTGAFDLKGIDTTGFSTWVSGTFTPVSTWSTLCKATSYAINNAAPTEIDSTTLCDKVAQVRFGLPGAKSGSISIQHDPSLTALTTLAAADSSDIVPFRITYPNGNVRVFGAYTAYGGGFQGGVNTLETGEIPITVPASIVQYTS